MRCQNHCIHEVAQIIIMGVVKTRQIQVGLMVQAVLHQLLCDKTRTLRREEPRRHRVEELAAAVSYNIFDKETCTMRPYGSASEKTDTTEWSSTEIRNIKIWECSS